MSKNLRSEAISSTGWGFLDRGSGIVIQFIIGIILARLLPPADFGLLGLGLIVIGFGNIFVNLGLGPALIYKQDLTERHVRVVFSTSVVSGLILATLVFFGAPLAEIFFKNDELAPIIRVLSIIFIIAGFQIPSQALLRKNLKFRRLFHVNFSGSIIYGLITISLSLTGYGVWSLVFGTLVQRIITLIMNYWFVRHSLLPLFAKKEFMDLAHFGSGITLSSIFNYFARQGDNIMVGRILGVQPLGLYTRAYALMEMPTQRFVSVLSDVLFPTAVKIQEDNTRFQRLFLKSMSLIAFLTLPLCILLVIIAPELIIGLYGEKWSGAIIPLQILGLFGVFRGMYNASAAFLRAKGFVYQILFAQIIYGTSMLAGVWLGATHFGMTGAAFAAGVAISIIWVIFMELNIRSTNLSRKIVYKTMWPGVIISGVAGLLSMVIKLGLVNMIESNWILLILTTFFFLIFVAMTIFFIPQKHLDFLPDEIIQIIQQYIPESKFPYLKTLSKILSRQ